jgi:hypothetical protein
MLDVKGMRVLALFAHSDDEMICAGTLHRMARNGAEVHVVTYAPAAIESDRRGTELSSGVVVHEWRKAMDLIGVAPVNRHFLNLTPSCDLQPFRQSICQHAYDYVEKHKPYAVVTLDPSDENTAHSIVGVETERVLRGRVPVVIRCQFPWNFSLGRKNLYVRLDKEDLDCKRQVIAAYKSQHFRYNYGEMLLHQVAADGLSVKVPAAEVFEIVREVL